MGKHRRRSWISGHEELVEDHFSRLQAKNLSTTNGSAANGDISKYFNGQKPTSAFSKIFQASTYFPILQHTSPTTTMHATGTSLTSNYSNGLPASVASHNKQAGDKSLLQTVLESLAVALYVFLFVFSPFLLTAISVAIIFVPLFWPIGILYMCW
jgi:hypothetical protein